MLIRYRQLLAAFGTTGSQHAAAILGGHSLTETVLVCSPAVVGLECSFHLSFLFICYYFSLWAAKVVISFHSTKILQEISTQGPCFFKNMINFAPPKR